MTKRWWVPVAVAAVAVGGSLVVPAVATAGADLPDRTPEQLLTDLQGSDVRAVQGTVQVAADLGLPALPTMAQNAFGSSTDATALLAGTTTLRVWLSADGARVAVHGTLGESDAATDGEQLWTWSSATSSFTHVTPPDEQELAELGELARERAASGGPDGTPGLGEHDAGGLAGLLGGLGGLGSMDGGMLGADGSDSPDLGGSALLGLSPEALSRLALAAIDPSTEVTSGPEVTVAGRPAYQLVLTPRDESTLVGPIRIAIDAAERVPLRVAVESRATGREAFSVGFTSVSFTAPDPSVYVLTPPPGATVTERDLGEELLAAAEADGAAEPGGPADRDPAPDAAPGAAGEPSVVGEGWSSVLVVPGVDLAGGSGGSGSDTAAPGAMDPGTLTDWLSALPEVSGPWGSGHLLSSNLLSVLLTDDGRLIVGAVTPEALEAAAAR